MKRTALLLWFFVIRVLQIPAQQIESALQTMATQYPAEKIYIHYDKDYYVAGETIWFKAYLYSNGLPSTLSNNFYLQLTNSEGKIISTKKYPVKGATVKGDIDLPDSIVQGYYHIRALTPAMLNTYQDFLYTKNIFVFNPATKTTGTVSRSKTSPLSIQFFPESGHLLTEVLSVVAFKATDSLGKPVSISGVIKTDDGTLINSFKTFYDGMGKMQFRPQAGKKYIAVVEINGQTGFYPLPEVAAEGINLRVENEKGGKMFLLSRSRKGKDNYRKLQLVAEMNSLVVYQGDIGFDDFFSVKGHLLTDSLPSGILHFTVFDGEGKPLAERLRFVNNGEYESNSEIGIIKKGMNAREENIVEISFPDLAQRSCSVSVTDAETVATVTKENIISKLLLTDDLEGYIDNPAYYFQDKQDTVRKEALDNLMLIHGWSRFSWKKILDGEFPEKKYTDNYLMSVSGTLKDSKTQSPVPAGNLTVFIESEDSVNHSFEIAVRDDGRFTIDSLLFFGKAKVYYAYKTAQGREKAVNISLDPQVNDRTVEMLPYIVSEKDLAAINADHVTEGAFISKRYSTGSSLLTKTKELEPVVVESKSNKRPIDLVNEKYTNGLFTSMGRVNVDFINHPENNKSLSVYDYVKRSIRQVMEQNGNFVNAKNFDMFKPSTDAWYEQQQRSLDSTNEAAGGSAPGSERFIDKGIREKGDLFVVAVFVNENLSDMNFLKTIRMDNIALIKFYEPGFVGAGTNGPGGALCVYTKNEVNIEGNIEKLDHVAYNGYSLTKEFYSPDYRFADQKQLQPDTRTTLYWDPAVYTDGGTKKVRLKFYNNDFSKRLKIVVEGFDATGRLIHIEKIIEN